MSRITGGITTAYFTPYIDASGIHMPTYEDRLQDLCSAYRTIFGQEAELTPPVKNKENPGRSPGGGEMTGTILP